MSITSDRTKPETKRIMIVDDSGMMRGIVKQIIQIDDAFEIVAEAADGYEAVERAKAHKPDVILFDIEMPKLNGIDAMKRLALVSKAKVVILSSVAQIGSPAALEAKKLGAFDVIPKPSGAISLDLKAKKGHEILKVARAAAGLPPPDFQEIAKKVALRKMGEAIRR
ncbi:MAG: response regulator [Alphaproteobacteria bacterium]|nr:response regulator [Alphaproteobacteria bacterium]